VARSRDGGIDPDSATGQDGAVPVLKIARPALDVVDAPMDAEIAVFELDHLIIP
jgi:hypothetical protein